MTDPKNPGEAAIDSVASAINLIWRWLSAEEEQSPIALLGGADDAPAQKTNDAIETDGEATSEWRGE